MRSVYSETTRLSYVETDQGAFFCHCNTLFIGTKCPDCQEEFSGKDLAATRELAFKVWNGSSEEQNSAAEPEVAEASSPSKASKKSKRTKSDSTSSDTSVVVDVDDIKPTEDQ